MTHYTVIWDEEVEHPFIDAWIAGTSETRAILTEIANWIDKNLSTDPERKGRPRSDLGARVIAANLLSTSAKISVTYEVHPEDLLVRVILLTFLS